MLNDQQIPEWQNSISNHSSLSTSTIMRYRKNSPQLQFAFDDHIDAFRGTKKCSANHIQEECSHGDGYTNY